MGSVNGIITFFLLIQQQQPHTQKNSMNIGLCIEPDRSHAMLFIFI